MIRQIFKNRSIQNIKFQAINALFSQDNKNQKSKQITESDGTYRDIIRNMRRDAKVAKDQSNSHQQLHKYNKRLTDHLVQLTLYMKHNQWKSQFIYSLFNYYKLGFKIVSDYAFLDSSSYMLQLRNLKQEQRWPTVRAIIGLKPRVIVTGAQQIESFFVENMYFESSYLKNESQLGYMKDHIDNNVLSHLQSLMWHPTLTYQTTFHTDNFYHQSEQKNYMLVGILVRNFSAVGKAISKNLIKIFSEKQKYLKSKESLTKGLKQLSEMYLIKNEYFGGQKPNFIDFYLYANFRTKWDSKYFKNYLQQDISPEFKRWLIRMGWSCQYVRDRITLL